VVLLGFAIGATTAGIGVLSKVRSLLQRPVLSGPDSGEKLSPWAPFAFE